jgi:predicted  nucleic acid-binding Zn-ribbon protein
MGAKETMNSFFNSINSEINPVFINESFNKKQTNDTFYLHVQNLTDEFIVLKNNTNNIIYEVNYLKENDKNINNQIIELIDKINITNENLKKLENNIITVNDKLNQTFFNKFKKLFKLSK